MRSLDGNGSGAGLKVQKAAPDLELWPKASRVERLRFRKAPLLAAAVCFALGEVMARGGWRPPVILLSAVLLNLGLVAWALRRAMRVVLIPVAGMWAVVGMWCMEVRPVPSPQTALLGYADNLSREVRGQVVRVRVLPPRADAGEPDSEGWRGEQDEQATAVGSLQVDVAVDAVEYLTPDVSEMVPVAGGVRATVIADPGAGWGRGTADPSAFHPSQQASRGSRALLNDKQRNGQQQGQKQEQQQGEEQQQARGELPELRCGDVVEAPMRMREPERYRDPGAWQYADYLLSQGMAVHASLHAGRLRVVGHGAETWGCRVQAAQGWAAGRVLGYVRSHPNRMLPKGMRLTADDAGMLNAMLFGDRTGLNHGLRLGFERTGSFHLFVVSGMHVALVAGGIFWVLRRLRLRDVPATLGTIALTAGYAVLTGFGAPVERALGMTTIFLVARLLSRERSVLNALGAAAVGVLVWYPAALFEASFQMTFLAIVAIAGIAVPLGERSFVRYARAARAIREEWRDVGMPPRLAQFRVMLRLWGESLAGVLGGWSYGLPAAVVRWSLAALELLLIGTVAEMVMVLPMSMYFHRATVFALPANMVSVPVVGLLVPVAVLFFTGVLLSPWLAAVPGAVTALLLHGVVGVIGRLSHVSAADVRVPGPVWWVGVLALGVWGLCSWAARRSGWGAAGVAIALPLVAWMVLWPERAEESAGRMEVTAIDVGQGDSLLVVGPEGQTMLVDAGGPVGGVTEAAAATASFDVGEEVVSNYLWSRRIRRLDVVALSHAHSDHMGGMPAVLRNFRPRELWVGIDPDSDAYRALLAEAAELGITVRHFHAGEAFGWGEERVEVLAPFAGYANAGAPKNDDSLVMRVEYGRGSVLLEGDAEAPSERAMVEAGRVRPVTLLKVGHHGSRSSTTEDFFRAAAPRDTVVSVGRWNTFGHPRGEVIGRIANARARMFRTDELGLTTFLIGRDGGIREVVGADR